MSIKIPWGEVLAADAFIREVHLRYQEELAGMAEVSVTGMMAIMGRAISASIRSMSRSYVIAFIVISALMVLLVGELKLGLLSMIPNLIPICLIMGVMGALGITIDLNALMIGSIAIGLVVDDTMHFMYNFKKYNQIKRDPSAAVRETMLGAGRALLITSLVLAANFFVMLAGELVNTMKFGFFTGLVILVALLTDFILAPALLLYITPKTEGIDKRAPDLLAPLPDMKT
ncbi:MAG: MMPL family transporter [Desulfobacterales bacterium]|nr:MMPL family transporter [Desulfobacterales bacterium]